MEMSMHRVPIIDIYQTTFRVDSNVGSGVASTNIPIEVSGDLHQSALWLKGRSINLGRVSFAREFFIHAALIVTPLFIYLW